MKRSLRIRSGKRLSQRGLCTRHSEEMVYTRDEHSSVSAYHEREATPLAGTMGSPVVSGTRRISLLTYPLWNRKTPRMRRLNQLLKTNMRDWLIKKLGGYTEDEWRQLMDSKVTVLKINVDLQRTIRELQALVPVSAVLPKKKRGRPRKYART